VGDRVFGASVFSLPVALTDESREANFQTQETLNAIEKSKVDAEPLEYIIIRLVKVPVGRQNLVRPFQNILSQESVGGVNPTTLSIQLPAIREYLEL
jgi:hypothetical protein